MSGNTGTGSSTGVQPKPKRAKLDLNPKVQVPVVPGNSFDIEWKASELIKVEDKTEGKKSVVYRTPTAEFKGLLWYVELRHKPKRPSAWQSDYLASGDSFTECLLKVTNKDKERSIDFDGCAMIATSFFEHYPNRFDLKDLKTSSYITLPRLRVEAGEEGEVVRLWKEEEILVDEGNLDHISLRIIYLGDNITNQEAKFFRMQMPLLTQMREDAKGVEMILKLVQIDNGGDERSGSPPEDFFIQSKNGTDVGFHKAVLKVRGGEFFKGCLKPGTKESFTSQLKWEDYDEEVVRGFKEYIYHGTISDLANHALDYFKLGDYCPFEQIRDLAEMELCKSIVEGGPGLEQALEIAKSYDAEYMKAEIMKIWKKKPEKCEELVEEHFYKILRA